MKKITSIFLLIVLCFSLNTIVFSSEKDASIDRIITSIPVSSNETTARRMSSKLFYRTDAEGNLYGPEDYTIDGTNAYILNSANNTILKYVSGVLSSTIDLTENDIIGIKIAVSGNNIYVLGNDLTVKNISDNSSWKINLYDFGMDEAITDFKIYDNKLYIGLADRMGGSTYIFNLSNSAYMNQPEKYHGYFIDKNTLTTVGYADDNATSIGDPLKIEICDLTTQTKEVVYIETEYLLAGVQYLGKDQTGNHIVKTTEIAANEDYSLTASETIRGIDNSNNTLYIRQIPSQVKNIVNQFRVFNGKIYQLRTSSSAVDIVSLGKSEYVNYDDYVSPLKYISSPASKISNHSLSATVSSITRDEIMDIAASYHSEFEWSCTEANIAYMAGYTKPRCINGAGNYTMMPYCWGGFHTPTQFINGLAAGGRAGNINTPSTGWVPNTYGIDCSGYVSRCWGCTSKYGTSTITAITTQITVDQLKKGDAFLKPGHIMLYERTDGNYYILYEATQLNGYDRVAHTSRSITNVTNDGYVPVRYNNVE